MMLQPGLMMDRPLLISAIIEHAEAQYGATEIVSRETHGGVFRYAFAACAARARKLANALAALGLPDGCAVGTLAWNNHRHVEIYYGVSGSGRIIHTCNPRLHLEQLAYIVNHAEDRVLFFDTTFAALVARLAERCPNIGAWICMSDQQHLPALGGISNVYCYEDLIASQSPEYQWPEVDERAAAALCYTSGTTGNPKGALYSHRSTVLHAFGISLPDAISISAADVVCPVVPMFHACAWGIPYAAPMNGAKLVMPGPRLDGASLYELFEAEGVTYALGVPTVWLGFEAYLAASGARCSTLHRVLSGGSAVPPSMIEAFARHGIDMRQGWGMTEMSPLGTTAALKARHQSLDPQAQLALKSKQGRP